MFTTEQFVEQVEAFLNSSSFTPTKLGREAVNDPNFVFQIRAGRRPNLESVNKVLAFMEAQKADGCLAPKPEEAA